MKIAYKCTRELVNNLIDNAIEDEREIDFIELSVGEWVAFRKVAGMNLFGPRGVYQKEFMYRDTRITRRYSND